MSGPSSLVEAEFIYQQVTSSNARMPSLRVKRRNQKGFDTYWFVDIVTTKPDAENVTEKWRGYGFYARAVKGAFAHSSRSYAIYIRRKK